MSLGALLPGEDPNTTSCGTAYCWSAVYQQLLVISEAQQLRLTGNVELAAANRAVLPPVEQRLVHQRSRTDFWRARAWRLKGVEFDDDRRSLTYRDASVKLSSREAELLLVLVGSPNRVFSVRELLERAWKNRFLAEAALRNYVGRLRAKLDVLQLADIVNVPGRGYLLSFRPATTFGSTAGESSLGFASRYSSARLMSGLPAATESTETMLPGEELANPTPTEALLWMGLYEQLLELSVAQFGAARATYSRGEPPQSLAHYEIEAIEQRLALQQRRLTCWRQQHGELNGLHIAETSRTISYCGQERQLSRREHQLFRYMMKVRGEFVPAEGLVRAAWPDARATVDQLRNYVRRLRALIAQMAIPCEIKNRPGFGYALVLNQRARGVRTLPSKTVAALVRPAALSIKPGSPVFNRRDVSGGVDA